MPHTPDRPKPTQAPQRTARRGTPAGDCVPGDGDGRSRPDSRALPNPQLARAALDAGRTGALNIWVSG